MNNKKLFAILTLVAFMMTLMPMAAFAAAADRFASFVLVDKTSVTADGAEKTKVEVYTYDNTNTTTTQNVYVATLRPGTDKLYYDSGLTQQIAPNANSIYTITGVSGKAKFYVASTVAGTTQVAAALTTATAGTDDVYQYLIGTTGATSTTAQLVGTAPSDITFTAGSAKKVTVYAVDNNITGVTNTVSGLNGDVVNADIVQAGANYADANGTQYYEISFKVTATGGAPIKDQEVTFSVSESDLALNKTTATTDVAGVAKVKVTSTKPFASFGSAYVKAKAGDYSSKAYLQFDATGAYDIQLVSGGNESIAKGKDYDLKFKVFDINGNQIKNTTASQNPSAVSGTISFEAITRPSDVTLPEIISDETGTTKVEIKNDADGLYIAKIKGASLDKEGDYVIKAYLTNGKSIEVPFTVKKQDTVVRMTLEYDSNTVTMGGTTSGATIRYYDAEDIVEKVTTHSNVVFSANPASTAATINQTTGAITTVVGKDYTGNFTVTAVNNDKDLAASCTMMSTREIASVNVVDAPEVAPGETSYVEIQLVDIDGNNTAFGTGVVAITLDQKVVSSKPEDAIVSVSAANKFVTDLQETGATQIKVKSDKAGEVVVNAVIKAGTTYYPVQITVNFKEVTPEVVYGAKAMTMFIDGAGYVVDGVAKTLDQAPFIKDSRTFVPLRAFCEDAFGATVDFDAATQVITITNPEKTVTMTINSNVISVAGAEDVVSDVAPYITDAGRTVIPFRAISDAFGASVEPVFGADGFVTAVTYQQ